jgi:hypothetical protein
MEPWLFVFAGIQALGVLLAFFRIDVTILRRFNGAALMPLISRREKVMAILALGSLILSIWGLYSAPTTRIDAYDPGAKLRVIRDKRFSNEVVLLDGIDYENCEFRTVT